MTGALVVFCVTYLVIASRQLHFLKLDRPAGAVVGAVAMVIVGGLPMDEALHAIDLNVLYRPAVAGLEVGGDWYDAFSLPGGEAVGLGEDAAVPLAPGDQEAAASIGDQHRIVVHVP